MERDLAVGVLNVFVINHVEHHSPIHGDAFVCAVEASAIHVSIRLLAHLPA